MEDIVVENINKKNFKEVPRFISSMLNRVPAGDSNSANFIAFQYSEYEKKFSDKNKLTSNLCKMVENNIFCDVDLWIFGSNSENDRDPRQLVIFEAEDKLSIEVKPLPLGSVALVSLPKTRSGSHPVSVNPKIWGKAIGSVKWSRWCAKPVVYQELKAHCVKESLEVMSVLQTITSENRFIEHKLPSNLALVKSRIIQDYLINSCTPILNGLKPNLSGELWLGIEDSTSAVIGVPSEKLCDSICTALAQFATKVTPSLLASQFSVTIFPIDWPTDITWTNVKCLKVDPLEGVSILKTFMGICRVYIDDSEENTFIVEVPDELWDVHLDIINSVEISRHNSWLDLMAKSVPIIWSKSNIENRTWINRKNDWFVPEETDYDRWTMIERKIAKICFSSDKEANGSYYVHDVDSDNFQGFAPIQSITMSKLQLHLRLKGLNNGAMKAGVYLSLCSKSVGKVLVTTSATDRNMLTQSLRAYMDGVDITLNAESRSTEPDLDKISILQMYKTVFILTTYAAWAQCKLVYKYFSFMRSVGIIVFIDIERATDDVMTTLISAEEVVDVVLLANTIDGKLSSSATKEAPLNTFYADAFETVPSITSTIHDLSSVKCLTIDWINRKISYPTWEMVQAGYVFATNNCSILQDYIVRTFQSREESELFQHIKINQSQPGSGATSMLYRIAWNLQNEMRMASCFLLNDDVSEEAVNSFLEHIKMGSVSWVVVFIDTNVVSRNVLFTALRDCPASNACIVTIVEFVNDDDQPRIPSIDPILSVQDVKYMTEKLADLFPDSASALHDLYAYTCQHPEEHENRHIYVPMLFATMGKFEPVNCFLRKEIEQLSAEREERRLINFLALLAAYCPTLTSMPQNRFVKWGRYSTLLVAWDSRTDTRISFRHPFLARKYLDMLRLTMCDDYRSLSSLLFEAEDVVVNSSNFVLDGPTKTTFYRDLLQVRWPNHHWPFSMFVCELLKDSDDTLQLLSFLSDDQRCPIEKGHRQILLSRIYRVLLNFEESINQAKLAEKTFDQTSNHNLACSNLGEAYGIAAKNAADKGDDESRLKYFSEMENWFKKCQKLKQLEKWQQKIQSAQLTREISCLCPAIQDQLNLKEILCLVYQCRSMPASDTDTEFNPKPSIKEPSLNSISLMKNNPYHVLADSDSE